MANTDAAAPQPNIDAPISTMADIWNRMPTRVLVLVAVFLAGFAAQDLMLTTKPQLTTLAEVWPEKMSDIRGEIDRTQEAIEEMAQNLLAVAVALAAAVPAVRDQIQALMQPFLD